MQRHDYRQGTPEWHAYRARARNASDAPAMLGCSPYMTRSQLLHAMHTGLRQEVTPEQQRIFDAGHAIEAAQRSGAEQVIGDELFPVVGSEVVEGIELSASFDGLTMLEDTVYECKTLNDNLREALPESGCSDTAGCDLPKMYRVQMEQQLAVCGGARVLFVAATQDGSDVRRCWYYPDPQLRAEILAGWRQFDADLAAYEPPTGSTVEKIVAEPVESLPAVSVQVSGTLVLHDNFDVFERALRAFLDQDLIREPKTDADFGTLERQIKAMKGAEDALDAAEAQMLAQVESVDQRKRRKDMLKKLTRDNRLMAEKLLTAEKERRRGELVAEGIGAIRAHVDALNKRLGRPLMPTTVTAVDFGGAIKGLRTIASMQDAIGVRLASAKITANDTADRIDANLKTLAAVSPEHRALFPDEATIVLKAPDDLQAIVRARVAEHDAAVKRRAEEQAERERARIRAEEEARARAQAAREQQEREAAERRQREETEAAQRLQDRERQQLQAQEQFAQAISKPAPANGPIVRVEGLTAAASAANVHPMPTRAPAAPSVPAGPPTLTLGEIKKRLSPLSIDDAGLTALGFPPAKQEGAAKLRHEQTFPAICDALIVRLAAVRDDRRVA